ncbi:MAG: HAD family phosphatase [Lachnospiraceae bacterium]|nr:HAD family phosphatase [Lachnospiraceae bacterium]
MVKLIASDLDGTLLQKNSITVSERATELIEKLLGYGVLFAPASGRQYPSIRRLFSSVADDLIYICLNGAYVRYKNEIIYKASMDRKKSIELLKDILDREGCEFLLDGTEKSYLLTKDEEYIAYVRDGIKNNYIVIKDFDEIEEDILKISIYQRAGIELSSDYFTEKWKGVFKPTVSGKCFMDFVAMDVNKGNALRKIKEKFNIETDFTMCFGDNFNDLEMFNEAYFSYAMTHSDSEIRKKARYLSVDVESILYDVFKTLELR